MTACETAATAATVRAEDHRARAAAETWPRLSETLTGPKHPERCQKCGRWDHEVEALCGHLKRWEECDDHDQPSGVYLLICTLCDREPEAGKRDRGLVARHPRLYREIERNAPRPGILVPLCVHCAWRDGVHCAHPDRKANGGPGTLRIEYRSLGMAHVLCSPRSRSFIHHGYQPAESCSGREEEYATEGLMEWPVERLEKAPRAERPAAAAAAAADPAALPLVVAGQEIDASPADGNNANNANNANDTNEETE